jgi:hypothetical protein
MARLLSPAACILLAASTRSARVPSGPAEYTGFIPAASMAAAQESK